MIDVKKLLYKKKQIEEARHNALIAVNTLEERNRRYRQDENWWIRSSLPSDPTLATFIREEDTVGQIEYLRWIISELNVIIDAVSRASQTLNAEQRELITLRYFDDSTVIYVCEKMHIKENKYNYTHKISLSAMTACLNPLCITEEHLDGLLFAPYKERLKSLPRMRKIQDFGELIGSPEAS